MSRHPSPEANWGRDDSDSLILQEQAKTLPEGLKAVVADQAHDETEGQVEAATGLSSNELLQRLTDCERDGKTYLETYINPARERSHKAYRNEHFQGSKYLSARYTTRSKLFKPKTRNAVRKAQAAAAGALFASADVVSVEAQDNSNQVQLASAGLHKELINYRLDRTNGSSSIPWFLVSMGAHQDALLDGVCASKQYWKFRERTERGTDPETGASWESTHIVVDRPDVLNIAPENIIFDPNAEWTRPAQTSSYLIARYPMPLHEVMAMMKPTAFAHAPAWIPHTKEELEQLAGVAPQDAQGPRNARSGGADGNSAKTSGLNRVLWVYENFLCIDGEDYCFWSIGNQKLLSVPKPTRQVYPHLGGERPYIVGFGAIETHRPIPMAPAESWQQLQQEANDITNLRLDQMKQVVTPLTKVRRGRQVDLEQVMRRGQDTVLMVTDMEDVEWDRPPDVPASAMAETNILNNDFDELAGTFSQGSIQSNRQMNETVGGMKLLSQGANSITEFDLRVWIETWVEPVLWQILKLEEFYESDAKILALAGQKAEIVERFGISDITDQLLMQDVTVRVSAGLGAADPMQKLEKFAGAARISTEILGPFIQSGQVQVAPNADEIINEVFGQAGYKGATDRFFQVMQVDPNAVPPEVQAQQAQAEQEAAMAEQQMAMEQEAAAKQEAIAAQQYADEQERAVAEHLAKEEEAKRKHAENLAKIEADKAVKLAQIAANEREAAEERDRRYELEMNKLGLTLYQGEADRHAKTELESARLQSSNDNAAAQLESRERMEAARASDGEKKPAGKSKGKGGNSLANPATSAFSELAGGINQLASLMAQMMESMNAQNRQVLAAVQAPKQIDLKRGANGIEGATVRTAA